MFVDMEKNGEIEPETTDIPEDNKSQTFTLTEVNEMLESAKNQLTITFNEKLELLNNEISDLKSKMVNEPENKDISNDIKNGGDPIE